MGQKLHYTNQLRFYLITRIGSCGCARRCGVIRAFSQMQDLGNLALTMPPLPNSSRGLHGNLGGCPYAEGTNLISTLLVHQPAAIRRHLPDASNSDILNSIPEIIASCLCQLRNCTASASTCLTACVKEQRVVMPSQHAVKHCSEKTGNF